MVLSLPLASFRSWCLCLLLLGGAAAGARGAAAPAEVGGSFLVVTTGVEYLTTTVYYLAPDGTLDQLSSESPGRPSGLGYAPAAQGTYAYQVVPGAPGEANLTLSIGANPPGAMLLGFTSGSAGSQLNAAPGFLQFEFFLPTGEGQLLNVSNRALLRTGDAAIAGFVIGGSARRPVLIRAVGPTLGKFGVAPVSPGPQFTLYAGTGPTALATGAPWTRDDAVGVLGDASTPPYGIQALGWIFGIIGAFPLNPAANEQVYFGFLPPGAYTVQTTDPAATAAGGWELTEVYIFPASL